MTDEGSGEYWGTPSLVYPDMRVVGLYGEVEESKCAEVIYSMMSMKASGRLEDCEEVKYDPFQLVVSTWGGSALDAFGVYDCMRLIKKDCGIGTLGLGKVMSAGVLILAAGTKGEREVAENCRVMIHSVGSAHVGQLHNLENELTEARWIQNQYVKCLARETDMSEKQIKKLMDKKINVYLTAEEAVDYGIADRVV